MKKTPLKKRRKRNSTRQLLANKAWKIFSLWIRTRDKFICFTCGVKGNQGNTNAGHFKHGVLDFDEININCQCIMCNHYKSGNLDVYAEKLITKYGLDVFNTLCLRARSALRGERMSESDYRLIIEKYAKSRQHQQD